MKSCDDMVNSLLERREQYAAKQKHKRKVIIRTVSVSCICLVALLSFGVWQSGILKETLPAIIGENGCTDSNETNGSTNSQSFQTGNAVTGSDSSGAANADVGNYPSNYIPDGKEQTLISSFDVSGIPSASYAVPENGEFGFSIPLREAMNKYGNSVLYRVIIDVFSDKEQLSPDSSQVKEECDRLSNRGYTVAYEIYFDGESYHYYFTVHATYEQLSSFAASKEYGYFMLLYDEGINVTEKSSETVTVYNAYAE